MKITSLKIENFRNIRSLVLNPDDGVNVLYGNNAQGKTNLLEAIWLCSGVKSFRDAKENELINFDSDFAKIDLEFFSRDRQQSIELKYGAKKQVSLNKVPDVPFYTLSESFSAVIFFPDHLSLIKEGPEERRKFIDYALCALKPSMSKLLNSYKRAVFQRNTLLKMAAEKKDVEIMLDMWEDALADLGSKICRQRSIYLKRLQPFVSEFYEGLSGGKEKLNLIYSGEEFSTEDKTGFENLRAELKKSRETDKKLLMTTVGPHRHNIEIEINGISAKNFGSQGQQRSVALALKLAEASVLHQYSGEQPVVLLDDVMSELDKSRQNYILNCLTGRQVFITCCDPTQVLDLTNGKAFNIDNGEIVKCT